MLVAVSTVNNPTSCEMEVYLFIETIGLRETKQKVKRGKKRGNKTRSPSSI